MITIAPHDLYPIVGITANFKGGPVHELTERVLGSRKVSLNLAENALFDLKKRLQRLEAENRGGRYRNRIRNLRSAIVRLDEVIHTRYALNPIGMNEDEQERAEELTLFAENTGELYPGLEKVIDKIKFLIETGQSPLEPTIRSLFEWFTDAAKRYVREVNIGTRDWRRYFTENVRMIAAKDLAERTIDRVRRGEFGPLNVRRLSARRMNPMMPCCSNCAEGLPCSNPKSDVGRRVELDPGTDLWMRGARYGVVKREKNGVLTIKMDHPGVKKLVRLPRDRVTFLDEPRSNPLSNGEMTALILAGIAGLGAALYYALKPKAATAALPPPSIDGGGSGGSTPTPTPGGSTPAPTWTPLAAGTMIQPGQSLRASVDARSALQGLGITAYTDHDTPPADWPASDSDPKRFRFSGTWSGAPLVGIPSGFPGDLKLFKQSKSIKIIGAGNPWVPTTTLNPGDAFYASTDLRSFVQQLGGALYVEGDVLPSDWPANDNAPNRWRAEGVWPVSFGSLTIPNGFSASSWGNPMFFSKAP